MPLLTSTFIALNPDIEKYQYANRRNYFQETGTEEIDDTTDLKNAYFLHNNSFDSKVELIKAEIIDYFSSNDEEIKISNRVYNNAIDIIDQLYPSLWDKINFDNIYASNYGTIIFDWEKENGDVFSLEVGSEKIGYFIEIDGNDIKQVDELQVNESDKIITDLQNFYF